MKYYWFVTILPMARGQSYGDDSIRSKIKRSITPPVDNKVFYITERVDGYNHYITDSKRIIPQITSTDLGDPLTIHNIAEAIKLRLIRQWQSDSGRLEKASSRYETDDEGDMYLHRSNGNSSINLQELFNSELRRKASSTKKAKRITPCKCKKNIRKVKK